MKRINVDDAYCKGCNLCITVCPQQALQPGTLRSKKGYLMPVANADKCVGCGSCEVVCADFAIVVNEEE